jgi:hypothetical protein
MARIQIEGLDDLIADIRQLENFPTTEIERSALKGANIMKEAMNRTAPVGKTGKLRGSFVALKGKPRRRNREAVGFYDIRVNPHMKDIFGGKIDNPGKFGGTRIKYYYPSAVEFGHKSGDRLTKRGNKRKGKAGNFVPGKHYMRKTASAEAQAVMQTITNDLAQKVDRILRGD